MSFLSYIRSVDKLDRALAIMRKRKTHIEGKEVYHVAKCRVCLREDFLVGWDDFEKLNEKPCETCGADPFERDYNILKNKLDIALAIMDRE